MRKLPLADRLQIKSPCATTDMWSSLAEEEARRTRFCKSCELEVHDATSMTRDEVEALLRRRKEGERLCFHLAVRAKDGAILLADGVAMPSKAFAKKRALAAAAAASAAALAGCGGGATPAPATVVDVAPAAAMTPAAPSTVVAETAPAEIMPPVVASTSPPLETFPAPPAPPAQPTTTPTTTTTTTVQGRTITRATPLVTKPAAPKVTKATPMSHAKKNGQVVIMVDGGI